MKKIQIAYTVIFMILSIVIGVNLFAEEVKNDVVDRHPPLYALLNDNLKNRQVGTSSHAIFEEVLLEAMAENGLKPLAETYRNPFDLLGITYDQTPHCNILSGGQLTDFKMMEDYVTTYMPSSGAIDYTGEIVFLDRDFFNTPAEILSGKVVMTKFNKLTYEVIDYAIEIGIKGLLVYEDNPQSRMLIFDPFYDEKISDNLYIANVSKQMYQTFRTFAKERPLDQESLETRESDPVTGIISTFSIKVKDQYPVVTGHNIIGKIIGKRSDHPVVFYTSYDGAGEYLGATYTNTLTHLASVSALLEMIQLAGNMKTVPSKDIYFAFLDGGVYSHKGIKHLLEVMPEGAEYIEIGSLGIEGAKGLNLGIALEGSNYFSKLSSILQSRLEQVLNTASFETGAASLQPNHGTAYLSGEHVPAVLLTQQTNASTYQVTQATDTIKALDAAAYGVGVKELKTVMVDGYFQSGNLSFIPREVKKVAYSIWWLLGLMLFINISKRYQQKKGLIVYQSIPYQLLIKSIKILLPTVFMLTVMLFILLVPETITKAAYNGQYTNYDFVLHAKRVVYYVQYLTSGEIMTSSLKTALTVGFFHTLKRFSASILIACVLGVLVGLWRGLKKSVVGDVLQIILYSIPDVLISLLGLYAIIFLVKHQWLGPISPEAMRVTVMPIIVMSIVPTIYVSRMIQMEVEAHMEDAFIYGAVARGVPKKRIIWMHLLPLLIAHLASSMASVLRIILVNLLVVEYLYAAVGIGGYLIINRQDPTYVLIISAILGVLFIGTNLLFKGLQFVIDPIRRKPS
jgi:ABC-type dipeptide/oligopeptide/nickel transport system permease component